MKTIKNKSVYLFSAVFGFVITCFSTCDSNDRCATEYYPVEGDGYIVDGMINEPVPYGDVVYKAYYKSYGGQGVLSALPYPTDEVFNADANGYFRIRFIKNRKHSDVIAYSSSLSVNGEKLSLSMVQKAKETIRFDTIKIFQDTVFIYEKSYYKGVTVFCTSVLTGRGDWKAETNTDWCILDTQQGTESAIRVCITQRADSLNECRAAILTLTYSTKRKEKIVIMHCP